MTGFESEQGYVNCGDTYLALDLEAFPGLYQRAVKRAQELNEAEAARVEGRETLPNVYTVQDVAQILIRESFTVVEAA